MTITLDDIINAAIELSQEKPSGRPPGDLCPAGLHDMETHARQVWKNKPDGTRVKNGRYCIGCKRIRQRTPGAEPRLNAQKPRREGARSCGRYGLQ